MRAKVRWASVGLAALVYVRPFPPSPQAPRTFKGRDLARCGFGLAADSELAPWLSAGQRRSRWTAAPYLFGSGRRREASRHALPPPVARHAAKRPCHLSCRRSSATRAAARCSSRSGVLRPGGGPSPASLQQLTRECRPRRRSGRWHHARRIRPVFDPVAKVPGSGVMVRSWESEKNSTGIATGLLTTRRYGPAHPGNASIEMSNEIGLAGTRQNALGRLQRFPKPKVTRLRTCR
jgi:hypothetical protein